MLIPLRQATLADIGQLFLVSAIWGIAFVFIELALRSFGPLTVAAFRITFAALVLTALAFHRQRFIALSRSEWVTIWILGLLNCALPFFLISWAQQHITAAEAAVLMSTVSFSTLIISHFTTQDERFNLLRVIGVLMGFLGVVVLFWDEMRSTDIGAISGLLAVIAAGICYATSNVISRRAPQIRPITMATYMFLTAGCYMLPIAMLVEWPLAQAAALESWLAVIFLGAAATALAYLIRFSLIRKNGAVFMSQAGYLVPIFGTFWGWLLLSNKIEPELWLALALIIGGMAVTRKA